VVFVGEDEAASQKTKVCNSDLNPVWDETLSFAGVKEGDTLTVKVYDSDTFGSDDVIGEVKIPFEEVVASGGKSKWYKVEGDEAGDGEVEIGFDMTPKPAAGMGKAAVSEGEGVGSAGADAAAAKGSDDDEEEDEDDDDDDDDDDNNDDDDDSAAEEGDRAKTEENSAGDYDVSAKVAKVAEADSDSVVGVSSVDEGPAAEPILVEYAGVYQLRVLVRAGRGLPGMGMMGTNPDPYAVVFVGGDEDASQKTQVCESDLNPVWDESMSFKDVNEGDMLTVQLFDCNTFSSDEVIGEVKIRMAIAMKEYLSMWVEMPNGTRSKGMPLVMLRWRSDSA
jgi:hypothetical protein